MRDEGEKKRGADWARRGEDASLNRNPAKRGGWNCGGEEIKRESEGEKGGREEVCNYKEGEGRNESASLRLNNATRGACKHTHTHTLRRTGVFQAEVARRDTGRKRSRFSSNICGLWKWLVFKKRNNFWWENANVTSWCCIWIISPGYEKNNTSDSFSQPFLVVCVRADVPAESHLFLSLFLWVAYFQPSLCRLKKKKKYHDREDESRTRAKNKTERLKTSCKVNFRTAGSFRIKHPCSLPQSVNCRRPFSIQVLVVSPLQVLNAIP